MTMARAVGICLFGPLLCAAGPWHPQAVDPQTIVTRHWPDALQKPRDGATIESHTCHAVLDRAGGELTRIAAVYWDGADSILQVLDRDESDRFRVTFESRDLHGIHCQISRLDVDDDGAADLLVALAVNTASLTSVFRATGTTFVDVTPRQGAGGSALVNAAPVDLDHAGPLEFVARVSQMTGDGRRRFLSEVYRYNNGRFERDVDALFVGTFNPASPSHPHLLQTETFDVPGNEAGSDYVLRVVNGRRRARQRATALAIGINGIRVAGAAGVNAKVELLDIPIGVPLKDENELRVDVTGAPEAEVTVVITRRGR